MMINNLLSSGLEDFLSSPIGILIFVLVDVLIAVAIIAVLYKYFFKYLFDFLIALIGSVITSPLALVVIILSKRHIIKTNEYTRVFTKTVAAGKNGKKVVLHSFTVCSELNGELTKLGAFLRKTGIEMLPRIYDVLICRLALVGVKPLSLVDEKFVSEEDYARFSVRPGLMNPLYIYPSNSDKKTYEEMFDSDKAYAAKVGLFTDLRVVFSVLIGKIRGDKRDVYGETKEKEYSKALLEQGEISLRDYEEALRDVQLEQSDSDDAEDDAEDQTSYDGTEK
jgi:lipopolysaccharide/colanic/teichoic acid biosynthesis glycosyltransferase